MSTATLPSPRAVIPTASQPSAPSWFEHDDGVGLTLRSRRRLEHRQGDDQILPGSHRAATGAAPADTTAVARRSRRGGASPTVLGRIGRLVVRGQERRPHDPMAAAVADDADPDSIGAALGARRLDHGHGAGQRRELDTEGRVVHDHPVADPQSIPVEPQHGASTPLESAAQRPGPTPRSTRSRSGTGLRVVAPSRPTGCIRPRCGSSRGWCGHAPRRRRPRSSRHGPALRVDRRHDRRTSSTRSRRAPRSATSHAVPSPWRGRRWCLVTIVPSRSRWSGCGRGPGAPFDTAGTPTTPVSRLGEALDRPRTLGGSVRTGGDARPSAPARRQSLPRCCTRAPFSAPDDLRPRRVPLWNRADRTAAR